MQEESNSTAHINATPNHSRDCTDTDVDISMAPRLSTKAHAKTDHGQSESNSQDASQDSGVALGQMASRFGDQMKKKVGNIVLVLLGLHLSVNSQPNDAKPVRRPSRPHIAPVSLSSTKR